MEGERRAPSYSNPVAVAAFWCGLAAAVVPCLGVVLGPYAAALALLGLRHGRLHPTAGGRRWAVAGLVLGLLAAAANALLMWPVFHTAW